jgi:hypothetical protein
MKKFRIQRTPPCEAPGQYPLVPHVQIVAVGASCSAGEVSISSNLMSANEIDHEIDDLMGQLEQLRKTAKAELA